MLPLSGLKVLSIEQFGAGPFGTSYLANLGAEVIKIENPGAPDIARGQGPYFLDEEEESRSSLYFQSLNFNKKSVSLDIKSADGRKVFEALVAGADAVLHNMRGDVPAKLGIDYASLAHANPRIVCAHLTAYGRDNERAAWPGYDYIMQAQAGYCMVTGEPGSPPTRFGLSIIDWMTGLSAAFGLVSGVLGARSTGIGGDVDVCLFDVALFNLGYVGVWELNTDHKQGKVLRGGHPAGTPAQMFKTSDGWIYIMAGNKPSEWQKLCTILDRPEWIEDPRFTTKAKRTDHREELTVMIDDALSTRTTEQWMALMGSQIPAGPVLDVSDALASPFVERVGSVQSVALNGGGTINAIRNPVRWSGETRAYSGAPGFGEHTDEILGGAGFSGADIARFRQTNVV